MFKVARKIGKTFAMVAALALGCVVFLAGAVILSLLMIRSGIGALVEAWRA